MYVFYILNLLCMYIFIVQRFDLDFMSMRYIKIDIIIIIIIKKVWQSHWMVSIWNSNSLSFLWLTIIISILFIANRVYHSIGKT